MERMVSQVKIFLFFKIYIILRHNTWEPVENILDERLIQEFSDRQESERQVKNSVGKRRSNASSNLTTNKKESEIEDLPTFSLKRGRRSTRAKEELNESKNSFFLNFLFF